MDFATYTLNEDKKQRNKDSVHWELFFKKDEGKITKEFVADAKKHNLELEFGFNKHHFPIVRLFGSSDDIAKFKKFISNPEENDRTYNPYCEFEWMEIRK